MENKNVDTMVMKKKILSIIGLIIFSLAFVFASLKNVLPIGKWIVSTFGFMTYPLFLVLAFIQLAKVLGLKYRTNIKSTVYVVIILISLLFVIQAISTYKQLDKVATFESFKNYLNFSYETKTTLGGGFGSIFVGGLSMLWGLWEQLLHLLFMLECLLIHFLK